MIVILSSLNGSDRLRDMLAALTHVRLPAGTTIHAVDNGSEDGTLPDHVRTAGIGDFLPSALTADSNTRPRRRDSAAGG